jgi:hypothetical protein
MMWRGPTLLLDDTPKLKVDCMREEEVEVHRALLAANLPYVTQWEGPARSLGSRPTKQWISFTGTLRPGATLLEANLACRILRSKPTLERALIGSQKLYKDSTTLLLEFRQEAEPALIMDLVEEAVFVSPRLLAITTTATRERWAERLTQMAQVNPERCVDRIRFRASSHGGRPWVTPELLSRGPRRGSANRPAPLLQCTISLPLGGGVIRAALADDLALQLQSILQCTWTRTGPKDQLQPQQWRPMIDIDGLWTGRIDVLPNSEQGARLLLQRIQGQSVTLGGVLNILSVHTDWRDSPTQPQPTSPTMPSGNGRGGRDPATPSTTTTC